MKKPCYIFIFAFCILLLSGCGKKTRDAAPIELFQITDGVTAAGIQKGDEPQKFINAYKDYTIQVAFNNLESSYLIMSIDDIPYEKDISAIIASFFIDGTPISEETLCEDNNVKPTQLHDLLSSPPYLRDHEVIYRYLRFIWNDGKINRIESDELNYNETYETPRIH